MSTDCCVVLKLNLKPLITPVEGFGLLRQKSEARTVSIFFLFIVTSTGSYYHILVHTIRKNISAVIFVNMQEGLLLKADFVQLCMQYLVCARMSVCPTSQARESSDSAGKAKLSACMHARLCSMCMDGRFFARWYYLRT